MRKTTIAIIAGAILFCAALVLVNDLVPPRLIIKFDGQPARNVTLVNLDSGSAKIRLDANGSIESPSPGEEPSILVPRPNGGAVSVRFPKYGTKIVDFHDNMATTKTVQYFGLVKSEDVQLNLTQEQVNDLESGKRTLADIEDKIRKTN